MSKMVETQAPSWLSKAVPMVIPIVVALAAVATAWGVLSATVSRTSADQTESRVIVNRLQSDMATVIAGNQRNTSDITSIRELAARIPTVAEQLAALQSDMKNMKVEQQYQREQIDDLRLKSKATTSTRFGTQAPSLQFQRPPTATPP